MTYKLTPEEKNMLLDIYENGPVRSAIVLKHIKVNLITLNLCTIRAESDEPYAKLMLMLTEEGEEYAQTIK